MKLRSMGLDLHACSIFSVNLIYFVHYNSGGENYERGFVSVTAHAPFGAHSLINTNDSKVDVVQRLIVWSL
jgi:hypothetical protein